MHVLYLQCILGPYARTSRHVVLSCREFIHRILHLLSFLESQEYFVSFVFLKQFAQPLQTSSLQRLIDEIVVIKEHTLQ